MGICDQDIINFKEQLQKAVLVCSDRCLYNSTKWAAEILDGIRPDLITNDKVNTEIQLEMDTLPELEYNKYQYAKSLFQLRQFESVSFVLANQHAPKSVFLRLYAKYLAGERRKEEQSQDILGASENALADNAEINAVYEELRAGHEKKELDAFCLYLYGVVLRKRSANYNAAAVLLESVNAYEYNWSAWMELAELVLNKKMFYDIQSLLDRKMPTSIMKNFFLARLVLELHQPNDVYRTLMEPLTSYFPNSTYIKSQWAVSFYDMMDYNESEILFDDLRRTNPYRLEDMDIFSCLLYLQDSKEKLSVLAHQCERIDKYRPETCCIIANYYSIRGEIAESVDYFKRALKLNRSYHLAWTLLGHDYIETKNTNAAIECYRRAINVNHRDFRAWYGLGQAYEVLKLPYYAIYYYQKATDLRPQDPRMWSALGGCYILLQRDTEARDCYKRASETDRDGKHKAMVHLARIYDKMGQTSIAARYYDQAFQQYQLEGYEDEEVAEAGLFLARYEIKKGRYNEAEDYATVALNYRFPHHEEAKSLMEEIRLRRSRSRQDL